MRTSDLLACPVSQLPRERHFDIPRIPATIIADYQNSLTLVHNLLIKRADEVSKNEEILTVIGNVIQSVELLCFDFAICACIFDPKISYELRDLFNHCFAIRDGSYEHSFKNLQIMLVHLKSMCDKVIELQERVKGLVKGQPIFSPIDSALVYNLGMLMQESRAFFPHDDTPKPELDMDVPIDELIPLDPAPAAEQFAKFVYKDVLGAAVSSGEVLELLRTVSHRLTTMEQLQERITVMRDLASLEEFQDEEMLYRAKDIRCSPHMEMLTDICCFMKRLLDANDKEWADFKMQHAAEQLKHETAEYAKFCNDIVSRCQDELRSVEREIENKQKLINDFLRDNTRAIQETTANKDYRLAGETYDKAVENFAESMRQLRSVGQVDKVHAFTTMLDDGSVAYKDGLKELRKTGIHNRVLMQLSAEQYRIHDEEQRVKIEADKLTEYEALLRQYIDGMRNAPGQHLLGELKRLNGAISVQKEKQSIASQKLDFLLSSNTEAIVQKIRETESEIHDVRSEIEVYDDQLSELELELSRLKELQSGKTERTDDEDSVEVMNSVYESNLSSILAKMMCPICKTKKRDTIITTCGHALCRSCIDSCSIHRSCPACLRSFTLSNLRPFFA